MECKNSKIKQNQFQKFMASLPAPTDENAQILASFGLARFHPELMQKKE